MRGIARLVSQSVVMILAVVGTATAQAADTFTSKQIADNIHVVSGPSGNTLVAIDSDGVILVEGVPAKLADQYLAFVKKLSGTDKIKLLVNTNWHDESAGLNGVLAKKGVTVVAHANTKQWLAATIRKRGEEILHKPVPKDQLPTQTFRDKLSVPFRGGTMELGYLFQVHTDGDIYARFPQQNVLFTGPMIHSDQWSPVDEATNGYVGAFTDAFDVLGKMIDDKTVVVPESGPLMNKAAFDDQQALYKNLLKEMIALLRKGRSADDVVAANPAVGLKPEWGSPNEFLDQGFRSFYGNLRDGRHLGAIP
ncbi:MAG TPA: hypothetical protein VMH83_05150 [Candidatus Acidoferrum sp.]|nr:hypothetical protein [Candidatus Acidoferrum sp.]